MPKTYSVYEAKARFSQIIREVRDGEDVTVSYRGAPVARIRAISKDQPDTLEQRIKALRRQGILVPSDSPNFEFNSVAHVPGALERFLADRNR